jgi:hypothetical protein
LKSASGLPPASGFLGRQLEAGQENIRLAGLAFHDVEFAEIEAQEFDVDFAARERGAVVFDINFRDVEKRRAAELRRLWILRF